MLDNDEIEEEKEDELKVNNNSLIKKKATVVNNNEMQVKTSNKKKCKIKLSRRLENDGTNYVVELIKVINWKLNCAKITIFLCGR